MDLLSFSQNILEYITNPENIIFVFWVIVLIVMFISLIMILHWKQYAENILGGIVLFTVYGIGVFILISNIYQKLQTFIGV
ncbi:MAG: hypothetical protein KBD26_00685 [Candidatus Pacebacteria bacterium]|nr:hypothetical protein [Candidatus Paceibacterota bacterium]MBP9772326.1 hypothetical protein [Candidatus Paceibacterota bacterium]